MPTPSPKQQKARINNWTLFRLRGMIASLRNLNNNTIPVEVSRHLKRADAEIFAAVLLLTESSDD